MNIIGQHPSQNEMHVGAHRCPVCLSAETMMFLKLEHLPVHCHAHCNSREAALQTSQGDMELAYCLACDHLFNQAFDPSRMTYEQGYENSLHFSAHFQDYASGLAARLIQAHDIYGKQIVEIGCGKGDFLHLLCELGNNRGIGFDPSLGSNDSRELGHGRVAIIKDYYTEQYADLKPDLIICRHVLEHLQHPREFLLSLRSILDPLHPTVLYVEVPNAAFTLRDLGIWDLIYEHCSYFSADSLTYLFQSCGFQVHRQRDEFHGQYLGIEVTLAPDPAPTDLASPRGNERLYAEVCAFSKTFYDQIGHWQHRLLMSSKQHHRLVLWGAGSKGVSFLNAFHIQDEIAYVVDINPRKQGHYIPGTGQKIVPPSFLTEYQPTHILVMNAAYRNEIKAMAEDLHLQAQVICV